VVYLFFCVLQAAASLADIPEHREKFPMRLRRQEAHSSGGFYVETDERFSSI
jgi:hypothetical protein